MEYIDTLYPDTMFQFTDLCIQSKKDEYEEKTIQSAFVGWQVLSGMGAYKDSFEKYLVNLGIKEKNAKKPRMSKEEAIALAERIKELDRNAGNI